MASISLRGLHKSYGRQPVLHGLSLEVADGEFVALVGPSGCGKSTLLRVVSGLEPVNGGEVWLGQREITHEAPKDRNIAMVFQSYALYPHMTVAQNLGFALKLQGVTAAQVANRVNLAAQTLGLASLLERRPRQLSGGQRQRVAMGRAIVRQPAAFLFDEPLSNLDAQLRVQMRTEIKSLHQRLGTTTLYVTHDQVEAMTMADRIVVLRDGEIEQVGAPLDLYDRPCNAFVAGFIGSPTMNFLRGRLDLCMAPRVVTDDGVALPLRDTPSASDGQRVVYGIRPEHFILHAGTGGAAQVVVVEPTGSETHIAARFAGHDVITAFRDQVPARPGDRLHLTPDAARAHLFDESTGLRLN